MRRLVAWKQAVINRIIHRPWIVAVRRHQHETDADMQRLYFSNGEQGVIYDLSNLSTVFQDAAGTIPGAVGQPVGRINDLSGNGNHATQPTETRQPILQSDGVHYWLQGDGVDDELKTASIDFTGAGQITTWCGIVAESGGRQCCASIGGYYADDGSFSIMTPYNGDDIFVGMHGTAFSEYVFPDDVPPGTSCSISGVASGPTQPHLHFRVNGGVFLDSVDDPLMANFSDLPLHLLSCDELFYSAGLFSSIIVRGTSTSDTDLIPGEEWTVERLPA